MINKKKIKKIDIDCLVIAALQRRHMLRGPLSFGVFGVHIWLERDSRVNL